MADEILISDIVDLTGISSDIDKVLAQINKVDKAIQGVNSNKVSFGSATGLKDIKDATDKLNEATKKLTDALQSNVNVRKSTTKQQIDEIQKLEQAEQKSYEKRQAAGSEQAESTALERERLRQRNLELKNTAIVNAAAEGSIQKMRAELSLLTQQYDKLSVAERNSARGSELQQKIKGQADALFKLESETGRYSRNVGNYTGATNILKQSLDEVKQKMDDLKNSGQGNTDEFKRFEREEQLLNQVLEKNVQGFSSLTQEIRANERALAGMFNEGQQNTQAYQKLETEISNAKRELGEFREQQKLLSSQTPLLSAATLAAKGLAGAYAVGAGAAALFADGDEKVQKELAKLVAIMTVLQGLQEVHELLEKRGTIAKIAGTVATKAQILWQKVLQATMYQSVTATVAFRVALIALTGGLLLLVPLIAFAGQKMAETRSKTKDTEAAMKAMSDVTAKAGEKFAEVVTQVDQMKVKLRLAKEGVIDKKKALEDYNTSIGKTIGQANSLNEAEQKLIDKAPEYIQFTFLKAKAEAAAELAKEALKKSIEEGSKGAEDFLSFGDKAKAQVSSWQGVFSLFSTSATPIGLEKTTNKMLSIAKDNKDEAVKVEDDKYKAFTKLQEKFFTDAANFAKTHKLFDDDGKGKDKSNKDAKDQAEKNAKAIFDTYKLYKERELELLNEVVEDEKQSLAQRVSAAALYVEIKQKLITDEAEFEKSIGKKTAAEIQLIDSKASVDRIKVAEDVEKKLLSIQERLKKSAEKNIDIFKGAVPNSSTFDEINKKLDEYKKKQELIAETEKKLAEERKQRLNDFINQLKEAAFEFATFSIDNEKNKIQDQIDALDKKKQKEIEVANQTIINERDNAASIAVIEARSTAQKEQLEKRQRQLDIQKAKIEKESALLSVAIDTAKQVFKIKAEAAVLAANPVTAPYAPIALAQIPLVLISGAITAALIAAKPIPKYFKGKNIDDFYEGLAWVGDGGKSEAIIRENGNVETTPATPTLTYVKKKDIILPDAKMLAWSATATAAKGYDFTVNNSFDSKEIVSELKQNNRLLKAIKNKPAFKVYGESQLDKWMNGMIRTEDLR